MPLQPAAFETFFGFQRDATKALVDDTVNVRVSRVTRRRTDGLATIVDIKGQCPTVSRTATPAAIGDLVVNDAVSGQLGSTGVGQSAIVSGSFPWLEKQEPRIMNIGETTAVTYFGGGFDSGLSIEYLLPRELWGQGGGISQPVQGPPIPELHPDITVENLTVIDDGTATADVTVAIGAQWVLDVDGNPDLGPVRFTIG